MKRKLIALAAVIGGAVIALVIAQTGGQDEWAAVGQGREGLQGRDVLQDGLGGGNAADIQARKDSASDFINTQRAQGKSDAQIEQEINDRFNAGK